MKTIPTEQELSEIFIDETIEMIATDPIFCAYFKMIMRGDNPYKLIEVLLYKNKEYSDLIKELSITAQKLIGNNFLASQNKVPRANIEVETDEGRQKF